MMFNSIFIVNFYFYLFCLIFIIYLLFNVYNIIFYDVWYYFPCIMIFQIMFTFCCAFLSFF